MTQCECHQCIEDNNLTAGTCDDFFDKLPLSSSKMIVCPDCRNKRCPRASDHRLECTESNEQGQEGSVYI